MTFISYAQNFEDIMLWRAFQHIKNGFYIDVGAAWPDQHSVTNSFYTNGWSGINIEPNKEFYNRLQRHRKNDLNLNIAISDQEGDQVINIIEETGLSSLDSEIIRNHQKNGWKANQQKIPVTTLTKIWENNISVNQDVHFLKVDVEGLEKKVLLGNDWKKNRPWLVVVESTLPLSKRNSHKSWEYILINANYSFSYADGLNRFYISKEHLYLKKNFQYPPNVFDDFIHHTEKELINENSNLKNNIKNLKESIESKKIEFKKIEKEKSDHIKTLKKNTEKLESKISKTKKTSASLIDNYENSLSWRITSPLRKYNPQRLTNYILKLLAKKIIKNTKLTYTTKKILERYPKFFYKIKKIALFEQTNNPNKQFHEIHFNEFNLAFASGPLNDQRGIGRVSKELLKEFKKLENPDKKNSKKAKKKIHFYSSIHWCPNTLPENSVIMIHDVIPMLFPRIFPQAHEEWLGRFKNIAPQANAIVTISQNSARDIEEKLHLPKKINPCRLQWSTQTSFRKTSQLQTPLKNHMWFSSAHTIITKMLISYSKPLPLQSSEP